MILLIYELSLSIQDFSTEPTVCTTTEELGGLLKVAQFYLFREGGHHARRHRTVTMGSYISKGVFQYSTLQSLQSDYHLFCAHSHTVLIHAGNKALLHTDIPCYIIHYV